MSVMKRCCNTVVTDVSDVEVDLQFYTSYLIIKEFMFNDCMYTSYVVSVKQLNCTKAIILKSGAKLKKYLVYLFPFK